MTLTLRCVGSTLVLGSWVGIWRPFHLSLFLTAPRMALPQDPSTKEKHFGVTGVLSTRILGRRTAPFPPFLIYNRAPHGVTPRS